ncbi:surface-associated interspersed protein (SURFIN) [Plasmodium relictum]|uniref:Surface-associated interspersed protein (SURFIN) n=1 Tax=Plasmodium relictum TaxID=85471 RepID=A0A1J1GMP8_PLARL|nr:surface-associated interspersed protein (SURFIN) [Plasmodium relictum]CRG84215.1 surface-associated interspersed protein (SURFIN) [Plasmodium relictum]
MNAKKEFRKRKTRNASTCRFDYDSWKKDVTSKIDFQLNDAHIERDPDKRRGICEKFNAYADEKKQELIDEKCKLLDAQGESTSKCSDEWSQIEAHIIDKIKEKPGHPCNRTSSNYTKKKSDKNGKKNSKSDECLRHSQSSISNRNGKTEALLISNNLSTTVLKPTISANTSTDSQNHKPLPLSAPKSTPSSLPDNSPISASTSANILVSTSAPVSAPTTIIPTSNDSILSKSNDSSNMTVGYTHNNMLNSTTNILLTSSSPIQNIDNKNISPTNSITVKPTVTTPSIITTSAIIPISIGFGSFFGILILLIFLYKCTPIGPWLGNRKSKKKKKQKKKKKLQIYRMSRSLGFPYEKSESNRKNLEACNKTNNFICEIILEKEINVNERYEEEELKENENEEKRERKEREKEHNERYIETKRNIVATRKKWKWKAVIEIHMMMLEECQKEEWELNRREFLKICLEEFQEEEGVYYNVINRDLIMETYQEEITNIFLEQKPLWKIWVEWNDKLIEKWKKEQWFKNLKKKWKKEVNKSVELMKKEEMIEDTTKGTINPMLERQKIIWKKWIQKQNRLHTFDEEKLLKQLVEHAKEEEMKKNMETIDREKTIIDIEEKDKAFKDSNKNELVSRLKIEIHMMVLDEWKKEEWILNKKEFLKTCIEELKIQNNSDEITEILEIEEIIKDITLEKKKDELEKMKKEKYFIELKQEWKNKEKKYMEKLNKENLSGNNEEIIENPMLRKQMIIWKKHWEEMRKKLKNENKNESFIMLMDEYNKEVIRKEADEISIIEKNIKEDEIEKGREKLKYLQEEQKEEINRKGEKERKKKEKKIKHMEENVEEEKKKNICMTLRKKPKCKTMIEIHMLIIEDCKQEEWESKREEFLEICLNEWLKDKGTIKGAIDKEVIMKGEEESSNVALKKQKILSEKWIKRQKKMLEKWKKEEWFNNLKEEWKKEEQIHIKTINKIEVMDRANEIEREKELWKQWIEKQKEVFMRYDKEMWFNKLLEEYEKEEDQCIIKENEENIKEKKKNSDKKKREEVIIKEEVDKKTKKKTLISHMCIEIHMAVLDQCKKEELESMRYDFLRSYIEKNKKNERLYEQETGNKEVDEIEKERQMNFIIEKKKEQWDCWKKEDWYQELKLNWKEEMKHMIKTTDKIKEEIINPMLKTQTVQRKWQEKQRNILKKWNKQNKIERPTKKSEDEEGIEDKNN